MPTKGGAEGARRAVTDAFGDFADREVVPAEQILRDRHPQGEQVFHRGAVLRNQSTSRDARFHHRGVPGLAEAQEQRGRARVMFRDGIPILVERRF